jgi:nucleotide-binding universal stress UspA family protein
MYKRILCPIDGSITAQHGLQQAIELANDQHAELIILHVMDNTVFLIYPPLLEGPFDEIRNYGKKILSEAQDTARAQGVTAEIRMAEITVGRVADAIIEQIDKLRADIVVMGTHGRRGATLLFTGSDAGIVVAASPVPVLLVK